MASTAPAADWRGIDLPQHKGVPGWEFTELKNFDLASYPKRRRRSEARAP